MEDNSAGAAVFRAALGFLACSACTSMALDARSFEGTRWEVAAINQNSTPPGGNYRIEFHDGRVSARFGCNAISGDYVASSRSLAVHRLISTKMACGAPADAFERAGVGILQEPLTVRSSGKGRLRLSNRVGTIDLQPLP